MNPLIEQDAREYGLHIKAGGWRLGLLVARNVEKGEGASPGTNQHTRSVPIETEQSGKVSARTFAKEAGTSPARVLRHLEAWEKAAAQKVEIPFASELSPGDEVVLDEDSLGDWGQFYDASGAGGYNGGKDRTPTVRGVEDALDKLTPAQRAQIAAGQLADPEVVEAVNQNPLLQEPVVEAATEALRRDHRRGVEASKERSPQIAAKDALEHIQASYDDLESAGRHQTEAQYEIVRWNVAMGDDWFDRMGSLIGRTRSATGRLLDHLDRTEQLLTENKSKVQS
jgi:hypothetical protein